MTLISQKMQNQNVEAILNLDQNKLFHHATQVLKLQFFEFDDFIKKEICQLKNSHLYKRHQKFKKEAPTKGQILDQNFAVYQEYFWNIIFS